MDNAKNSTNLDDISESVSSESTNNDSNGHSSNGSNYSDSNGNGSLLYKRKPKKLKSPSNMSLASGASTNSTIYSQERIDALRQDSIAVIDSINKTNQSKGEKNFESLENIAGFIEDSVRDSLLQINTELGDKNKHEDAVDILTEKISENLTGLSKPKVNLEVTYSKDRLEGFIRTNLSILYIIGICSGKDLPQKTGTKESIATAVVSLAVDQIPFVGGILSTGVGLIANKITDSKKANEINSIKENINHLTPEKFCVLSEIISKMITNVFSVEKLSKLDNEGLFPKFSAILTSAFYNFILENSISSTYERYSDEFSKLIDQNIKKDENNQLIVYSYGFLQYIIALLESKADKNIFVKKQYKQKLHDFSKNNGISVNDFNFNKIKEIYEDLYNIKSHKDQTELINQQIDKLYEAKELQEKIDKEQNWQIHAVTNKVNVLTDKFDTLNTKTEKELKKIKSDIEDIKGKLECILTILTNPKVEQHSRTAQHSMN